jgi:TonB family protein
VIKQGAIPPYPNRPPTRHESSVPRFVVLAVTLGIIGTVWDINMHLANHAKLETKPEAAAANDVNYGPYMADLQRRIKRNWFPPRTATSSRTVTHFTLDKEGNLLDCRIQESSGSAATDKSGILAVQRTAPFAPMPEGSPPTSEVEFTFAYNVHGGQKSHTGMPTDPQETKIDAFGDGSPSYRD